MGKGSHTTFYKMQGKGMVTYVVPTARKDVLICYVRECRKRFELRAEDGVTDEQFYDG